MVTFSSLTLNLLRYICIIIINITIIIYFFINYLFRSVIIAFIC